MGYRAEVNCINGFNLAVVDVDGTIDVATTSELLKEYTYIIYHTKRSTDKINRFRLILPLSHKLYLTAEDFKEFMDNIYSWLPFEVDTQTGQRARKWLTSNKEVIKNTGKLVDSLLFIPKTKKSEDRQVIINSQSDMNNIERWFASNTGTGNRSNNLIRYGFMLVDSGMPINDIQEKVIRFNSKLPDSLPEVEVYATIMQTLSKRAHERGA